MFTSWHTNESINNLSKSPLEKTLAVIDTLDRHSFRIDEFLYLLSWGTPETRSNNRVRGTRDILVHSPLLPDILHRWIDPPGTTRRRPEGATKVLHDFSLARITEVIDTELESVRDIFLSPTGQNEDVYEKNLVDLSFGGLADQLQSRAPVTWSVLSRMATNEQLRTTQRSPEKIVLSTFAIMSFSRSQLRSRLQKLFAIYFKFSGMGAKAFDTLHALGVTMSFKWVTDAVDRMSSRAQEEVIHLLKQNLVWFGSHDNLEVSFRVYSQRSDHQGAFGSGTAATIYVKPSATPLPPTANRDLQVQRAVGAKQPLTACDILVLAASSYSPIHTRMKQYILQALLRTSDFESYRHRNNQVFQSTPSRLLPSGPNHAARQFLLGTVDIAENSYDGNVQLMDEWLSQLGFGSEEDKRRIGTELLMFWIGDELTVERLRTLQKYQSQEDNAYGRWDYCVFIFGWFHLAMLWARSIHKQFLGTSKGQGLRHVCDLLERKGLGRPLRAGPFHHDLEEVLLITLEAHLRELWLKVAGVVQLSDLCQKSPQELDKIAEKILNEFASSRAMEQLQDKLKELQDLVLWRTVMFNRDVLHYAICHEAIKTGDVGILEAMLPQLLYRFTGGRHSKYTIEVLEELQGLHREWPPAVSEYVRNHCWLINFSGDRDSFLPIDQAQEHNIKDIKVTHRSEGPSINWGYLKKLHPAMHVIRTIIKFIERQFGTLTRGGKHTSPSKETDITKLQESFRGANIYTYTPGRVPSSNQDIPPNYVQAGTRNLAAAIKRWASNGRSFIRSTLELWDGEGEDNTL